MWPEGKAESREEIHPCARSKQKRAALEWDRHFTGRLRCPRCRLCPRGPCAQEICERPARSCERRIRMRRNRGIAMHTIAATGAGFLLAVLWFDLMFDVQTHKHPGCAAAGSADGDFGL